MERRTSYDITDPFDNHAHPVSISGDEPYRNEATGSFLKGANAVGNSSGGYTPIQMDTLGSKSRKPWQRSSGQISGLRRWWKEQTWWPVEILGWMVALAMFLAIVALLAVHNQQPIPEWWHGITLNAVISVLTTIGTIALMMPVTSALGQLKWMWFLREKRMGDFDVIDQASRGPWGSFLLLVKGRGGLLAIVGAFIVMLNLAIHPFFQQVASYRLKNILDTTGDAFAQVPTALTSKMAVQATGVSGTGSEESASTKVWDVDLSMKASIYSAIFSPAASSFDVSAFCWSNECKWANYLTLAVCSRCMDISEHLTYKTADPTDYFAGRVVTVALPNDFKLEDDKNDGLMAFSNTWVMSSSNPSFGEEMQSSSVAYKDQGSVLADAFVIWVNDEQDIYDKSSYNARECVLEYCVKTLNSTMVNGTLTEEEQGSWSNTSAQGAIYQNSNSQFGAERWLSPPDQSVSFHVPLDQDQALINFLGKSLNGIVQETENADSMTYSDSEVQAVYNATNTSPAALESLFATLAKSMTQNLRSRTNAGPFASGDAYSDVLVVHIEWVWMILPLVVLLLSLAFLLSVLLYSRTKRVQAWKSSVLPVLLHGLPDETINQLEVSHGLQYMDEAGEELKVRLIKTEGRWRLTATST